MARRPVTAEARTPQKKAPPVPAGMPSLTSLAPLYSDAPPQGGPDARRDETAEVAPEVDDGADERPRVQGHVEGLVEVLEVVELVPVEQPGHEDEVAARRDGEELAEPLGDPEHDGVQD